MCKYENENNNEITDVTEDLFEFELEHLLDDSEEVINGEAIAELEEVVTEKAFSCDFADMGANVREALALTKEEFAKKMYRYKDICEMLKNSKDDETVRELKEEKKELEALALSRTYRFILATINWKYSRFITIWEYDKSLKRNVLSRDGEDLVSCCNIAILENLYKYNPELSIVTFALWQIIKVSNAYIAKNVSNNKSLYYYEKSKKVVLARRELEKEGFSNPSIAQIAEKTGYSIKQVSNILMQINNSERIFLDADEGLKNSIASAYLTPEQEIMKQYEAKKIGEMLSCLSELERYVFLLRNGEIDTRNKMTYKAMSIDPKLIELYSKAGISPAPKYRTVTIKKVIYRDILCVSTSKITEIYNTAVEKLGKSKSYNEFLNKRSTCGTEEINIFDENSQDADIDALMNDNEFNFLETSVADL